MTACCPCDDRPFPPEPDIPAGLSRLPRQVLGFPEYRRALLSSVRRHAPLAEWRAREGDDLGLMIVEWWAYVLDVVGFYDQEIAQNLYLQTAVDLGAMRRLTNLIGYRPRPAVAAEALLAAIADPGLETLVAAGTAFRSEAFGQEPPQVFESDTDATISPHRNRWILAPRRRTTSDGSGRLLFEVPSLRLVRGAWAVFAWPGSTTVARIRDIRPVTPLDGTPYAEVTTQPAVTVPSGVDLASVSVRMPTAAAGLSPFAETPASSTTLLLDAVYPQIARDPQVLLVASNGTDTAYRSATVDIATADPGDQSSVAAEARLPHVPATRLTFASALAASVTGDDVSVHFQFVDGGRLTRPAETRLQRSDLNPSAAIAGVVEPLDQPAGGPLLVQDRDKHGAVLDAVVAVDASGTGTLTPAASSEPFATPLIPPVEIFGNVIHVIRGETVAHEVLGSGDATQSFPSFRLKKKPLTYIASPNAPNGRKSTLEVRVNGILWGEVDSFYGTKPDQQVYIVRQDEEQNSTVTFWRLPSGVGNVVARYRFGAGAAKPPAGSLSQIVRPVKGLARAVSPVMPFGGADADKPKDIAQNAPSSALTLGRAVSLADFEALARSFGGVVNVSVGWAWDQTRQRAVVKIWYIADGDGVAAPLRNFLIAQADPTVPIVAAPAVAIPTRLVIDVATAPRFEPDAVASALITTLGDAETGMLAHANVPIGGSIFRSALFATASGIPGVAAINGMTVDGAAAPIALSAHEGEYLDFLPYTNT